MNVGTSSSLSVSISPASTAFMLGRDCARLRSGPATPVDGTPLVEPRKRAQSRPSMKAVLTGEIDTESELDVPTFIRRHNSQHGA